MTPARREQLQVSAYVATIRELLEQQGRGQITAIELLFYVDAETQKARALRPPPAVREPSVRQTGQPASAHNLHQMMLDKVRKAGGNGTT